MKTPGTLSWWRHLAALFHRYSHRNRRGRRYAVVRALARESGRSL